MKEHPILFSTPMVQAILEGRKTQTRRIVKKVPVGLSEDDTWIELLSRCPFGSQGDILWVRETYNWDWKDYPERTEKFYFYKATTNNDFLASGEKWKPSIFMPKDACRIKLKITGITVQKLHDITEEDAKAEGVIVPKIKQTEIAKYVTCYSMLWDVINGKESWQANPWVWAIEFKKIKP